MGSAWSMTIYMGMVKSDMLERFAFYNLPQLITNGRIEPVCNMGMAYFKKIQYL